MSDIELPDLPPPHRHGGTYESAPFTYYTAEQMRAYAIADREKRAQAAQAAIAEQPVYAYAVHFPDQQHEELVHDLDDALEDMTNYEHAVTKLYALPPKEAEPAPQGVQNTVDERVLRRMVDAYAKYQLPCDRGYAQQETGMRLALEAGGFLAPDSEILDAPTEASKPVQAEAPSNRPSPEWYRNKIAETLDDDFVIGPATKQAEAPTASNERELLRRARSYVWDASTRYYDGTDGASTRKSAITLVGQIDAALATQQEAPSLVTSNRAAYDAGYEDALQAAGINVLIGSHHDATQQEAQPQAAQSKLDPNESDPLALWAEIARLKAAIQGPTGFASWQDAAVHERLLRVKLERSIKAAQAEPAGGDKEDADKYRLIRRGQHWSVVDGIGNTLRGDDLDAAVDAIRAARAAQQATGQKGGA